MRIVVQWEYYRRMELTYNEVQAKLTAFIFKDRVRPGNSVRMAIHMPLGSPSVSTNANGVVKLYLTD